MVEKPTTLLGPNQPSLSLLFARSRQAAAGILRSMFLQAERVSELGSLKKLEQLPTHE